VMLVAQMLVIGAMVGLHHPRTAAAVGVLTLVQLVLMRRLLGKPRERAPWYNGTGTTLYVIGMLVCAFALGGA
jgi:chlorophyll synthase